MKPRNVAALLVLAYLYREWRIKRELALALQRGVDAVSRLVP